MAKFIDLFTRAEAVDVSVANQTLIRASNLFVGGAGAVKVDTQGGDTGITFTGVIAGQVLPILVTKVYSAGTTATDIVALSA